MNARMTVGNRARSRIFHVRKKGGGVLRGVSMRSNVTVNFCLMGNVGGLILGYSTRSGCSKCSRNSSKGMSKFKKRTGGRADAKGVFENYQT